jgi:hypothetical protein
MTPVKIGQSQAEAASERYSRRFCVSIPLVGQERHSLGAGESNRATTASGVKVAQHPEGQTLTPAQDGGAR